MNKSEIIRKIDWQIMIILIISAIVRFWGIGFGLPNMQARPDETTIIEIALRICQGDLNPQFFLYPTLYIYMLSISYIIYYLFGYITGHFANISDMVQIYRDFPLNYFMIDRCISVVLGVATVYVIYKLALLLFNRRTALISSFFLSLAYMHARDSHFGVTDVPATFFIVCSVLFIAKASDDYSLKNCLVAGFFAGLATAIKYIGIFLILPAFLINLFNNRGGNRNKKDIIFDKRLLLFAAMLVFVFFLCTPYALLDYSKFISDTSLQWWIINYSWGSFLGRAWWYQLKFTLFYGLGWSLLIAALAGIIVIIRTNFRKGIILLSFPLIYYLLGFKAYAVYPRYAIPLIPFLCITGAVFTVFIGEMLESRINFPFKKYLVYLLAIVIIVPSGISIIKFDKLISIKDNRVIAEEWITNNLRINDSLYQVGTLWGRVRLQKFKEGPYDNKWGKNDLPFTGKRNLPRYVIVQRYPLIKFNKIPHDTEVKLAKYYNHIKSFPAIDVHNKDNLFDQVDCFYIPFAGMKSVIRPGPNLDIYELKQE